MASNTKDMSIKNRIIVSLILVVFVFLFGSFISWDINPKSWDVFGRMMAVMGMVFLVGLFNAAADDFD